MCSQPVVPCQLCLKLFGARICRMHLPPVDNCPALKESQYSPLQPPTLRNDATGLRAHGRTCASGWGTATPLFPAPPVGSLPPPWTGASLCAWSILVVVFGFPLSLVEMVPRCMEHGNGFSAFSVTVHDTLFFMCCSVVSADCISRLHPLCRFSFCNQ
jgi:hypothetical protein